MTFPLQNTRFFRNPESGIRGAYRYGFNSQEKETQITGGETHTSAEFWMYDARAGRRWQLDPKPQIKISDYACLANNPLLLIDPLGDKVKYSKDENVSKKEFRQMKHRIRELRRNSETFSTMFDELKNSKEVFTYNLTNETGGDAKDKHIINIGLKFTGNTEANGTESYDHAQYGLIAHETAHKFREINNLDIAFPSKLAGQDLFANDYSEANAYKEQFQKAHEQSEKGAMHIENIVRSEMTRAGKFGTFIINQYYAPIFILVRNYDKNKGLRLTLQMGEYYDLFADGQYSKEYYNRKIDIYEELGLTDK